MFNRFTKEARSLVEVAEEEARRLGSPSVEAEHLLLAYAATHPSPEGVGASGLTREALIDALRSEFESSLRGVGVSDDLIAEAPDRRPVRKLRLGASLKIALERAVETAAARGDRRIAARHVALGVLLAKRGTVPRALRLAGFDPEALAGRI